MANRLIKETSPYLLQHANNPVDWYAWRPEAFEKAKREDKPMLVSIGYSTCHWCHVMEHESFEDEETAALMNELFVCIKVDREERPDVDMIYMEVVQMISGQGGWPLNCFLLPDGSPFYGGTYFPPEEKYGRPSWKQVLQSISSSYRSQNDMVKEQAARITESIKKNEKRFISEVSTEVMEKKVFDPQTIFNSIKDNFDMVNGGFGAAPKFPQTALLDLLLAIYYYTKNEDASNQVTLTLDKMLQGGIYDQIGGGFSRYATDNAWLVPHFEKMLYDNALLVKTLSDAYRITKDEKYKRCITETLTFIENELTHPDGGFFTALDADSEGVEGKFYVWSKKEIDSILGVDSKLFCELYDVTEEGNWEETNILNLPVSIEQFCNDRNFEEVDLLIKMHENKTKLLVERNKRIRPGLDDKILMSWNGLMISALSEAGQALADFKYIDRAVLHYNAGFRNFKSADGGWFHTYKNGIRSYEAMLDDYASWIEACISLHQGTQQITYLEQAVKFAELVIDNFYDPEEGLFYYTSANQDDVIIRKKEYFDNATPSGNAQMCRALNWLGTIYDKAVYKDIASRMLDAIQRAILLYPTSFGYWVTNGLVFSEGIEEIIITGPDKTDHYNELKTMFSPSRIVMTYSPEVKDWPLIIGKDETDQTLIYFCKEYNCLEPVHNIMELKDLLKA